MENQEIKYYTTHTLLDSHGLTQGVNNVLSAYCVGVKNTYNPGYFILRQLASSYIFRRITDDYGIQQEFFILKHDLHQHEKDILHLANQTISLLNTKKDNLIQSKQLKLEKGIKPRKSKSKTSYKVRKNTYYQLFTPVIDKKTYYQHLDTNLLCNILKQKEKNSSYKDFTLLPSHVAQCAIDLMTQDVKNYYASLKAYFKNPEQFTGQPQLPKYKPKNSRLGFSLDQSRFNKEGIIARVITEDNIHDFTSIKDKANINQLYCDNAKTQSVDLIDIESYNSFRLMPFIDKKIAEVLKKETQDLKRLENIYGSSHYKPNLQVDFVEIKFTPLKHSNRFNHTVKVEIIVKHTLEIPENSALNNLLNINAKFLELSEKSKVKLVQEHIKYNKNKVKNKLNIAGGDLGKVNIISIGFTNNEKAKIISGNQYYKDINQVDVKIDKRKSELNNDTIRKIQSSYQLAKNEYENAILKLPEEIKCSPEYIELINQSERDNNTLNKENKSLNINAEEKLIFNTLYEAKLKDLVKPTLSKSDFELLKQYESICRTDKELVKLQEYKNNYIDDVIHKISHHVINMCLDKNIDYFIIGKNDGWKQDMNLGKKNNRDFHNFPHSELIEKIQYKALKYGIVVLLTEESYTSQTSFINNAELKTYSKHNINEVDINNIDKSNKKLKSKINKKNINVIPLNLSRNKLNFSKKIEKEVKVSSNVIALKPINNSVFVESIKTITSLVKQITNNGGKRTNRNTYVNDKVNKKTNKNVGKIKVHADVNGSFNIIRKIFINMIYNKNQHNFNYEIMGYKLNRRYLYELI